MTSSSELIFGEVMAFRRLEVQTRGDFRTRDFAHVRAGRPLGQQVFAGRGATLTLMYSFSAISARIGMILGVLKSS